MTIGERIKSRRTELGMSQQELANKLGYSHKSSIGKIENGNNDITQSKVVAFAHALDTTVAYLMGWEEEEDELRKLAKEKFEMDALSSLWHQMTEDQQRTFLSIGYALLNTDNQRKD